MKGMYQLTAVTIIIALACALCRQVPNPTFNRVTCPQSQTYAACELQAPPWFCAAGTPDGWDTCACGWWWGPCLPVNLFGNFAPATHAAGFYTYDGNPWHEDEWIGSPMGHVSGWFRFTGSFHVAQASGWIASPLVVVGDTFPVWLMPVPGWQRVSFYAFTGTPADTMYLGGWAKDTVPFNGPNASCYIMVDSIQAVPLSVTQLPAGPVK